MNDVPGFEKRGWPLRQVVVMDMEWEGFVMRNFAARLQPFAQAYALVLDKFRAWGLPNLRMADRRIYDVAANWKIIFQNYSECYHCPTVHPVLNQLTPFRTAATSWRRAVRGRANGAG